MEKEHLSSDFELIDHKKNNLKAKGKIIYNLKLQERNNSYCETCPRDIGKKCNCKW